METVFKLISNQTIAGQKLTRFLVPMSPTHFLVSLTHFRVWLTRNSGYGWDLTLGFRVNLSVLVIVTLRLLGHTAGWNNIQWSRSPNQI